MKIRIDFFKNGQANKWGKLKSLLDFFFPYHKNYIRNEKGRIVKVQDYIRAEAFTQWVEKDGNVTVIGRTFCTFRAFFFHYLNSFLLLFNPISYLDGALELAARVGVPPELAFQVGAIATDAFTGRNSLTGNGSFNHTVTGSNPVLVAGVASSGTTDNILTAKYNTVSMTADGNASNGVDGRSYIWRLTGPATGTHSFAITQSNTGIGANGTTGSYTGCKQTGQPDAAANTVTTASGNITASVTVVATGSWLAASHVAHNANPGSAVNGTERSTLVDGDLIDSNATVGTGAQTIGYNWGSSDTVAIVAISIAVVAGTNYTQTFTESAISLTSTIQKATTRILTGSITLTSAISKAITRILTASALTLTSSVSSSFIYATSLTDSVVHLTSSITKAATRILTSSGVTLASTVSMAHGYTKALTTVITLTDAAISRGFSRTLSAVTTLSEQFNKLKNGVNTVWTKVANNLGTWTKGGRNN